MLKVNRYDFLKQCALAKKSIYEVIGCIIDMENNIWIVDDTHPDYPRVLESLSSSKTVTFCGDINSINKIQQEFLFNKK
jgi:hypothetical protein